MKNLARLFFLFVFLFFLPQRVEAAISSISATAVITSCPQLLSGADRCEADLYAMTTDGSTETFNATYGIDFRTGSPPGVLTYLWDASPHNTGTITVGPTSQYLGSFYTTVNNGTGTCALSEGQVYARPRIDQVCTLCFTPDSYGITNIGAMVHIHVNTSTGANAGGALVSFSPSDYSEGSRYADSNGNAYAFQNLNCSIGHTVSASWNGETGSIWLPAQSGSDPSTLCNGTSRTFTINLNPATPPPGAPSAGGSTIAYCPSAGSSTGNMDVYWSGGSGATSHRINYGVGCDAHNDACPNDVTLTVSPQTINGFSLGNTYNWEIFACNAGGCTPTAGGYYTRTFPSSCAGPTATPTPPPASTCVGAGKTCGTSSSPVTGSACTTSGGAAGTWQWDGQPSSSSCFTNPNIYCYTCVGAAPTSPPPVDPYCPNIDTDGRPNACVNVGSCPAGYSRKPFGDNACTTSVTLDPLCPLNDLDGRTNACQNSCTGGRIAKGGAADAACQSGGYGTFCCHDYAPKWCCHQDAPTSTPPPPPPPPTCPNGVCSGESCSTCPADCGACPTPPPPVTCPNGVCSGESCSTCPADCGACPTPTPTITPTPTVFIRGRLMEDTNNDNIPDRYYQNQLVSLSGATATSGFSTNPVPFSSAYNFNFVGIPTGIYNINFSMPPSYTLVSGSSAKPVSNLNVTNAGNSSTTWTIELERQCENTPIDDDTDLFVDCNDSMCHCDGKISNPLSCGPTATCPTPIPTATPTVAPPTPTPTNVPGCVSSVGAACGIKCCNNLSCTSGGVCANPTSTPTPTPTNTPTPTVSATPIPQEPGPDTECSDNVDNADPEDTLRDGEDPGCIDENGYWDPNDDNESDKPSCATSSLLPARVDAGYTATAQVLNCVSVTPPFEWTPTPINKGGGSQCSDGSDNDSDSLIDSFDPGCHSDGNPSNPSSYNPKDNDESNSGGPLPECSDGADNDADSFIDFPADPGCTDPNDNNESSIPYPECSDGIDNGDADPLADYLDPECHSDNNPTHQDTYDPNDPSESGGADTCSDASISGVVTAANASSSRATWTAPTCPGNQDLTCPVGVTINGAGGSVDINIGTVTVNPTYNVTARTLLDDGYNNCTGGSSEYSGNVQVSLTRTGPLAQETRTRTMTGSETFYCQIDGQNYELAIAPPVGYRGVSASITGGTGSSISPTQFSFSLASTNPTVTFCITNLAPWYQTDAGDVRFNTIDNPVPPGKSASKNVSSPSLLFSSSGNSDIGLGNASPNGDKEWVIDQEYNYNKNMKSVNGAAAYTFYKSRIKQRNIALNTINNGASGSIAPSSTGIYEITVDSNENFNLTGYTHPPVSGGAQARVVLLVPGNLTISSEMKVPTPAPGVSPGFLIVAVKGTLTIDESVGDDVADYASTTSHLDGIFTSEEDILIPGNLCADGITPDLKLNIAGSLVANARKPFAEDPTAGIVDNQRSLCQADADYASLNVATRPEFLLQLTDFYKTTYTRWKEVRP